MNDDEFDRLLRERHLSFVAELADHAPTPPRRAPDRPLTSPRRAPDRLPTPPQHVPDRAPVVLVALARSRAVALVRHSAPDPALVRACLLVVATLLVGASVFLGREPDFLPHVMAERMTVPQSTATVPQPTTTVPQPTAAAPRQTATVPPGDGVSQNNLAQDVAPSGERWVIEFSPDSAKLSSAGWDLVRAGQKAARDRPFTRVYLIGRTASVGPAEAAVLLSRDRAAVVRDLFVDSGVDPGRIRVEALGFTAPLVPDRDGRGELIPAAAQRNRSVEVVLRS